MMSCARRSCVRGCFYRCMTSCCLRCRKRKSKLCASWCGRRWKTSTSSAFRFWWRLGWARIGAIWIDDHFEAAALDRFTQVPAVADALNAAEANERPRKNRVAELEQRENPQWQRDQGKDVSQHQQRRREQPQPFTQR